MTHPRTSTVGFLVVTDQLMDIIGGLWMILYLHGWKIGTSFDNLSALG